MGMNFEFVLILAIVLCGSAEEKQDNVDYDTAILNLSGQGWKNLDSIDFSLYPNVEEIDLSNNNLQILREDVFQNNKKLKKLNLANNTELFLPEYATLLISDIEELNLTGCNIFELPSNIFDGLQNLKVIDLRNNPLKIVESYTFNALQNPQILYLPHTAEETVSEICTSVEELEIIVDSKENHTYKCLNNTIYHKELSSGKLHLVTPIEHETNGEDFKETDENGNIDMVSEEVYPFFMDQEQNDQPAEDGYEGSAGGEPSLFDKIEEVKTLDTDKAQEENAATNVSPVDVKEPSSPEEISTTSNDTTEHKETSPEQSEIVPQKTEENPQQSEAGPEQPETSPEQSETVPQQTEENPQQSEASPEQPETVPQQTEENQQQSETSPEQPEAVPQQTEENPQQSETNPEQPEPVPQQTEVNQQSETNSQQSETSPQQTETNAPQPQETVVPPSDVKKETDSPQKAINVSDTTASTILDNEQSTIVRKNPSTFTNSETPAKENSEHLEHEKESKGADPRVAAGSITNGEIKAEGSIEKSTSNANIFIILGVAVVCIGLAAFGYRWYKNRTYKAANTEEPIERELKEITVHQNNGIPKQEQEPLMQNPAGEGDNKHNGSS